MIRLTPAAGVALALVHLLPAVTLAGPPGDVPDAHAPPGRPAPHDRRIRTIDHRVRALLDEAVAVSPSLRALVERIERSDVVVYVHCERSAPSRVAGRLTFVTAAGGLRYVVVRLTHLHSRAQQIALLAHELQHAVEIADTPAIVDGPSLAREYARFGHVTGMSPTAGVSFDTAAAVAMGRKVLTELSAMTGD